MGSVNQRPAITFPLDAGYCGQVIVASLLLPVLACHASSWFLLLVELVLQLVCAKLWSLAAICCYSCIVRKKKKRARWDWVPNNASKHFVVCTLHFQAINFRESCKNKLVKPGIWPSVHDYLSCMTKPLGTTQGDGVWEHEGEPMSRGNLWCERIQIDDRDAELNINLSIYGCTWDKRKEATWLSGSCILNCLKEPDTPIGGAGRLLHSRLIVLLHIKDPQVVEKKIRSPPLQHALLPALRRRTKPYNQSKLMVLLNVVAMA